MNTANVIQFPRENIRTQHKYFLPRNQYIHPTAKLLRTTSYLTQLMYTLYIQNGKKINPIDFIKKYKLPIDSKSYNKALSGLRWLINNQFISVKEVTYPKDKYGYDKGGIIPNIIYSESEKKDLSKKFYKIVSRSSLSFENKVICCDIIYIYKKYGNIRIEKILQILHWPINTDSIHRLQQHITTFYRHNLLPENFYTIPHIWQNNRLVPNEQFNSYDIQEGKSDEI